MTRPTVGTATEEMYGALGPANTDPDEDAGWALLAWVHGVGGLHQDVYDLVRDTDDRVGWEILLDPDRCPAWALPWLAQFNGVRWVNGLTETQQRARIRDRAARNRGTVTYVRNAVRSMLTGGRTVLLEERYTGNHHLVRIRYYTAEAAWPHAAIELAIAQALPAGIRAIVEALPGQTWADLIANHATWADVIAAYPTWQDVIEDIP